MNLESILTSDDVILSIQNNLEYLLTVIPEIKDMIGFDHKHPHHHLDVWQHTLYAMSISDNNFEIRLVLLLHDIGKPHSYIEQNSIRHFPNHGEVSSNMAKSILKRFNYPDTFIKEVCYLIKEHDIPITKEEIKNDYELAYKKYQIQKCDALAHNPDKLEKRIKYLKRIKKDLECN